MNPPLPPPHAALPTLTFYPNETQRIQLHDDIQPFLHALELSPDWIEVENRPWSNNNNRYHLSGCKGYDYVQYDPRIQMRFFLE